MSSFTMLHTGSGIFPNISGTEKIAIWMTIQNGQTRMEARRDSQYDEQPMPTPSFTNGIVFGKYVFPVPFFVVSM